MSTQHLAPIVLFVYNRPEHTRQTLESLMANELADQSELYIYADGPKESADSGVLAKIAETRTVIREKQWCGRVHIVEAEKNKGLADSIVQGVTEIVNRYGKIIVLEDDIVTSPGFLTYMNDALLFYEAEEKVMHISGFMFPVKEKLPPTFFIESTHCWGWATWKRAWKHFNNDAAFLLKEIQLTNNIKEFNVNNSSDYFNSLKANAEGKLRTWAVRWYASCFLKQGLALHPYPSLVNNIGNDGTGINSKETNNFFWSNLASEVEINSIEVTKSLNASKALARFFLQSLNTKKQPIRRRLIRRARLSILSLKDLWEQLGIKSHRFFIKLDERVKLAPTARIKRNTKIEVRYGGSIEVGSRTELLDYVCLFTYGGDIKIGTNCSINPFTIIYGHGKTIIGDNVLIAGHCMIIPNNHNFTNLSLNIIDQGNTSKGIIIEDDVWIAHGCSILDGVTIGKGAIVAAGSVVNKSIPPYTVYAGVPAKFIKNRVE